MAGKGDRNRTADRLSYESNWNAIFGKGERPRVIEEHVPQTNEPLSQHRSDGADLDRYKADKGSDEYVAKEKKGAERLDRTSIVAKHWAECFCEEFGYEDIIEGRLTNWFADYWWAINDPYRVNESWRQDKGSDT